MGAIISVGQLTSAPIEVASLARRKNRSVANGPLTRFGARLIVRRHVEKAAQSVPSLKSKRIHPPSLRHSTAVYLLKSGVDLSTIAHWLGHSSINTTHKYVSIDLEAKRAALAKAAPITTKAAAASRWKPGEDLLKWLESLGVIFFGVREWSR